jgi:hypothetical protein
MMRSSLAIDSFAIASSMEQWAVTRMVRNVGLASIIA